MRQDDSLTASDFRVHSVPAGPRPGKASRQKDRFSFRSQAPPPESTHSSAPPRLQRPSGPATHILHAFPNAWECSKRALLPLPSPGESKQPFLVFDEIQVPSLTLPKPQSIDVASRPTVPPVHQGVTLERCQLSFWHVLGMIKSKDTRDVVSATYMSLRDREISLVNWAAQH